jgi:hypothetical protein
VRVTVTVMIAWTRKGMVRMTKQLEVQLSTVNKQQTVNSLTVTKEMCTLLQVV